jgi:sortase A
MRIVERAAYGSGFLLIGVWLSVTAGGRLQAQHAVEAFEAEAVDQKGWSAQRIAAYEAGRGAPSMAPLALLKIPRLGLTVPVLDGTEDRLLDVGVGLIEDTARPGESGNVGIAGHRDGFFRGLKDVRPGDTIQLATREGESTYVVEDTWIVQPQDVSVLEPTTASSITLVTCYPFYYVGSAPQRFIVRATRSTGNMARASGRPPQNR